MAPKAIKPKLPDIPWGENDSKLIWSFLSECEKQPNYKILFGKKNSAENTSGETKTAVFKSIGAVILPELFAIDAETVAKRLRSQLERLTKTYREHAQRLKQTGGGLDNENEENSQEEYLKYYIPGEEKIEQEFKFFPRLHKIYVSRPNVTPIVLTTALGPHGWKTVWYQPPDKATEDAVNLLSSSEPQLPISMDEADSPPRAFGQDITQTIVNDHLTAQPPTPVQINPATPAPSNAKRPPKFSGASQEAIERARSLIEKVPQKRSLVDTILEMTEANNKLWNEEAKEKLRVQKRSHVLEEFKLGLIDKDEYKDKIAEIDGKTPPSKRQRLYSPDWDEDLFERGD